MTEYANKNSRKCSYDAKTTTRSHPAATKPVCPVCKSAWPIFMRGTGGADLAGLGAGLSGFLAQQPERKGKNSKHAQINIS